MGRTPRARSTWRICSVVNFVLVEYEVRPTCGLPLLPGLIDACMVYGGLGEKKCADHNEGTEDDFSANSLHCLTRSSGLNVRGQESVRLVKRWSRFVKSE